MRVYVCVYADRIPAKIGRFESITCLDRAIPCQQLPCYFVRTKPILVFIYSTLQHTRANNVHVYAQGREGIYILKVSNATKKRTYILFSVQFFVLARCYDALVYRNREREDFAFSKLRSINVNFSVDR